MVNILLTLQIVLSLIIVINAQTNDNNNNNIEDCLKYPPGLTLKEYSKIMNTISLDEFNNQESSVWHEANCFTWQSAMKLEKSFPFLICEGNENSFNNGVNRKNKLRNAFESLDKDKYKDDNLVLITVLNANNLTCFMASAEAKDVRLIPAQPGYSSQNIRINPMSYYMKILVGTLTSVSQESYDNYIPLYTMVCPGILEDLRELDKIDDIDKALKDYLLEPAVDSDQSNALRDLYWAQKVAETDQAQNWLNYAKNTLNPDNEQCKDMIRAATFRFYRSGGKSMNGVTMMETRLYSSYISDGLYFNECVYAVILAISLKPTFCSVQARPPVKPKQYYYQYNTVSLKMNIEQYSYFCL